MKYIFQQVVRPFLPQVILERKDKMGFPTPLTQWMQGKARDFVHDVFSCRNALNRTLIDNRKVLAEVEREQKFSRKVWGMLCLELWEQAFHDQETSYKKLLKEQGVR